MKYIVSVTRIGYGGLDLEVEADSEAKAKEIALDQAGSHAFSEHHSEYQVDQVGSQGLENVERDFQHSFNVLTRKIIGAIGDQSK